MMRGKSQPFELSIDFQENACLTMGKQAVVFGPGLVNRHTVTPSHPAVYWLTSTLTKQSYSYYTITPTTHRDQYWAITPTTHGDQYWSHSQISL